MNPEDIKALEMTNIQVQSARNWLERTTGQFVDIVAKNYGKRASEMVGWYIRNLFYRYTWEQKRRVELEMILAKHCPELLNADFSSPKREDMPKWMRKKKAA